MKSKKLERCQISVNQRLVDAMEALDAGAVEIALVISNFGQLVGTLTDGDIRRALLKGAPLDAPLAPFVQTRFTAVSPEVERADVLDLMQARTINQIPIVDTEGRLVGLHLLHELIGSSERSNWAVIMAGGQGVRLRPVTEYIPKPMIPVAGRPILERLVLHLVGFGIRRIFLAINYLGTIVEEHFGNGERFGCRIDYLRESSPLGTGGALALLPGMADQPLIILNGDLVTQVNISNMLRFHDCGGYKATLGVREYAHMVPFGCVETREGHVTRFEEKPVLSRLINTGVYVLNPDLISRIPAGQEFPITNVFEDCLTRDELIGAYEVEDDWLDIGRKEQLKEARGTL